MAEEIEIVNVGGDGVASEATLKSLADSIKALAKSTGKDPRAEEAKLMKTANEARKSGIKVIKDQNDAMEDLTTSAERASKQMDSMGRGIGNLVLNGIGAVLGSAVNLGKELAFGGDRMTDFARHLPVVGGHLAVLTQFVDDNIDSFRQLAGVGVDFGETIFEVRRQAAVAGVSLDAFQQAVINNSTELARFGGNAQSGARALAQISGSVSSKLGDGFDRLGISMEEQVDYTAQYLAQQTRVGRAQTMTQAQLSAGAGEYILQLDRLAKLTGKSRDELAAEMAAEAVSPAMNILYNSLADGGAQIKGQLSSIGASAGPEMRAAMEELIAFNGVPQTEFAKSLLLLNPELSGLAQNMRDNNASMEDIESALAQTQRNAVERARNDVDILTVDAQRGGLISQAIDVALGINKQQGDAAEVAAAQNAAMEDETRSLLSFQRRVAELRGAFNEAAIENGIFGGLQEALSTGLRDGLGVAMASTAVVTAIAGIFAANSIKNRIADMIGGGRESRRGGGRGGMMGAAGRGAGAGIAGLGRGVGAGISGLGNGLAAAGLKAPAIIAGGVAIGAAIGAIGLGVAGATWLMGEALPNLAEGLEPFGEIDGAALKSASVGLLALSGGIAAFGAGSFVAGIANLGATAMDTISEFLGGQTVMQRIEAFNGLNIDAASMQANAEAIVAFGNAMAALDGLGDAAKANMMSNLFDGITNFFGGDTALPIAKISDFGSVTLPVQAIRNNAEAVVAYANAMDSLSIGADSFSSLVSNAFDAINSVFFGDDKVYPWDKVKLFADAGLDKAKVQTQSEAVAAFANAMSLFPESIPTERVGGVFGSLKDIFFGEVEFPWDSVKAFGDADISAEGVQKNADAMVAFATGIAGFTSVDIANVALPNMRNLSEAVQALDTNFDSEKIDDYEDALFNLADTIDTLNEKIRENNALAAQSISASAAASGDGGGGGGASRELIQMLSQLNTTMENMKEELDDQGDTHDRIMRAVRALKPGI